MPFSAKLNHALIDVAMGRKAADLVISKGTLVCVQSGELLPNTDVAIKDGCVAYVGLNATHTIHKDTLVVDAKGKYIVPGLLDGHMHVESSMLTVTEFVRAVVPHGTTGIFVDPHEIANVFGLMGVKLMVDEAVKQPIHIWVQVPSCVPSAPGLETPGAEMGLSDVSEAMKWNGIIGLGEVMNYSGVAAADPKMLAEMEATRAAGKIIGGHYASPDLGLPFNAYAVGGAEDDHEGINVEDAIARIRQGMKAMLRYGSAWQDVAGQIVAVTKLGLDPRHFIFCTDDSQAVTLISEGHVDRVLRHAIEQGLAPMAAIQMATLNTAEHFGLSREIGLIAPGRWADIVLVEDLRNFNADLVIARGKVVAENGELMVSLPKFDYPGWATQSVHLKHTLTTNDFRLPVGSNLTNAKTVNINVIGIKENQAPTKHLRLTASVNAGEVHSDILRDLAKVAVIERHHGSGMVQIGLVKGFGFTEPCAVASTVAHDCHHMIVVGTDDKDMAIAANKLAEVNGGQVVVMKGKTIGLVELNIAGLMSTEKAGKVAKKAGTILQGFRDCGCKLNNPNMQLSLLALVVIPELRLSDKGLVDVSNLKFLPVVQGLVD